MPNNENKQASKKQDYWFYLFIVIPFAILTTSKDVFTDKVPEMVMAGVLGMLGTSIGFLAYFLTIDKTRNTKIITFAVLMIVILGTIYHFDSQTTSEKKNLITCPVCGYFALEKIGDVCEVCLVEINESFMEYGDYNSLEELVKKEQLFFFLQNQNDEIDWKAPKIFKKQNNSYLKDENWKPVLTQEEIGIYQIKNQ